MLIIQPPPFEPPSTDEPNDTHEQRLVQNERTIGQAVIYSGLFPRVPNYTTPEEFRDSNGRPRQHVRPGQGN